MTFHESRVGNPSGEATHAISVTVHLTIHAAKSARRHNWYTGPVGAVAIRSSGLRIRVLIGHQNALGRPACFRTALARWREGIALSTTKRWPLIGLCQISWSRAHAAQTRILPRARFSSARA